MLTVGSLPAGAVIKASQEFLARSFEAALSAAAFSGEGEGRYSSTAFWIALWIGVKFTS
jgi:hypothetical protein